MKTTRQGTIVVGADADLAFIDPAGTWTVRDEDMLSSQQRTLFAGRTLQGALVRTILRGETIYQAGSGVSATPGYGRFLSAQIAQGVARNG